MKKTISMSRVKSRKMMLRGFLRWVIYAAVLLLFYLWLTNPLIKGFCPLLIIPLATAVAMHEGELAAGVFGVFCGFMIDLAGGAILGFTSLWLLVLCPAIALLGQFWIKINLISHFVINLAVSFVIGLMDFFFLHWVWEADMSGISLRRSLLPAYLGAVIGAVPVYLAVRFISRKMRPQERHRPADIPQAAEESTENIIRE